MGVCQGEGAVKWDFHFEGYVTWEVVATGKPIVRVRTKGEREREADRDCNPEPNPGYNGYNSLKELGFSYRKTYLNVMVTTDSYPFLDCHRLIASSYLRGYGLRIPEPLRIAKGRQMTFSCLPCTKSGDG